MRHRRRAAVVLLAFLTIGGLSCRNLSPVAAAADTLPSQLTDEAFWRLITDFSEPNGYFRSDNFLSNERAYQRVIPELQRTLGAGGVYLGVGPEQNFAYLVALKPKLAFIVDIRRGNLQEHLLYKSLLEMSADRADFLSHLFARGRPANVSAASPVDTLLAAYQSVEPSDALFSQNLQAVQDRLTKAHHFALSPEDLKGIEYVYQAFYAAGPNLNYSFVNGAPTGGFGGGFGDFPTYADLMVETDGRGEQRGYLASEENFHTLVDLEKRNAVIPIVGNFAGPKALRSVGRYLSGHGAAVSAFYTSNVEMYLFQTEDWKKFYANVATLPLTPASTFIRSVSNRGRGFSNQIPGMRSLTRLSSIAGVVTGFQSGAVRDYGDVIAMSR
jgi:hypothetical protein